MSTDKECREEFEAKCKFMRVEYSLDWDEGGFYSQLETDRCYTWFKLGFDQARVSQDAPVAYLPTQGVRPDVRV